MSGRALTPDPSPPEPASEGQSRAKIRILLPIALSVAAVVLFLIAFWPDSHGGKKGHSRSGRSSDRGSSPVGGSDREDREGAGNASVKGAGSPVGGSDAPARSGSKGETWWYKDEGKSSQNKGDQWWYKNKKDEEAGAGSKPTREAEAPKNSGPDDNWWHD
jgi:hypothetical protein